MAKNLLHNRNEEKEEMKAEISNPTGLEKEEQTHKKTWEEWKKCLHEFLMKNDKDDKKVIETKVHLLKTAITDLEKRLPNTPEDRARKAALSSRHLIQIQLDVGSFWKDVGAELRVSTATIRDIEDNSKESKDKAWEVLNKWKQQEGNNATVGRLEHVLEKLKRKDVSQKLLECAVEFVEEEEMTTNKQQEDQKGTFLPSDKDFHAHGVIRTLTKNMSAKVLVTRSSDGEGDANDVLNFQILNKTRKTDSCGTAEAKDSWWRVDLGENYFLFLTHYALRHGKKEGNSILCNFQLQGSIDGKDWKVIDAKNSDNPPPFGGRSPYLTGTWPVRHEDANISGRGHFRYFQIVQTGINKDGSYGIYLYGIEFYGVLIEFKSDVQTSELKKKCATNKVLFSVV